MRPRMRAFVLAAVAALTFSALGFSQATPADRLQSPIVPSQRTVTNQVQPLASRQNDVGRVNGSRVFNRMILLLQRSAAQETDLQQLLKEQQDPTSPQYHKWLTPAEFGTRFGPSNDDMAKITGWLKAQGFTVGKPSIGRQFIFFTGTSAQVETAFQTQMDRYSVNGKSYIANARPASIPKALAPDVRGVASLSSFGQTTMKPQYHMAANPKIQIGSGAMTRPADLAAIYDATPLQKANVEGQGQSIALIEESNIDPQDVAAFRAVSGLPSANLNVIVNGPDPGLIYGEETEAIADVEYAGSLAPDATLNVIVTASTPFNQGIDLSTIYAVDYDVSPITSLSYGGCETYNGNETALYGYIYEQGAAEGISHFVSAGDYGGDACGFLGQYGVSAGYGVNAIGDSQYNVSVGGTEFIMPNPDTYFPPDKNYTATGYIPESTWNDYQNPSDGRPLAGGGGVSLFWSKPYWQAGPGVPADGARDVPDVSLLAGDHLVYMLCEADMGGDCSQGQAIGIVGTSLASPTWASIQALVNQKNNLMNGAGNPNPTYYQLAAGQNSPFHDITVGDTKVPDIDGLLVGYQAGTGYDLATGLGSVDVNALATGWLPPTGTGQTTVTLNTGGVTSITHGDPLTASVSVAASSGTTVPSGDVAWMAGTEGVYQSTLDNTGISATDFGDAGNGVELPGGTYNLVAHYAGDTNFAPADSNPIALTVAPEPTQTYVQASIQGQVPYGTPISVVAWGVGVNSGTGYAVPGNYSFTDNGNPLGTSPLIKTGEGFAFVTKNLAAGLTMRGANALPAGTHTIYASSPPASASFLASTAATPATVVVVPSGVLVSLTPDHTSPALNAPVNFQVGVTNLISQGVPVSGWVEIRDYSTQPYTVIAQGMLGSTVDQGGGFDAYLQGSFATAGLHNIVAVYYGDANDYGAPSGAVDLNVGAAGAKVSTSTTISPGAGLVWGRYALAKNNISLSATVAGDTGGTTPTGTVTFTDAAANNATVGAATLDANGMAVLTTKALTAGAHRIVVSYPGDANFTASTSQAMKIDIADFTVSDNPSSVSVAAGQSASITFNYSGSTDFTQLPGASGAGSIAVSCTGLPQGAQCGFSNAVITPTTGSNGTTSGSVKVTITTTGPTLQKAANQSPQRPFGGTAPLTLAGLFAIGLPLIFRKRRTFTVLLGLVLLAVVGTLNGCNGYSAPTYTVNNPGTAPGTSTVNVTATVNGGALYGTLTHTATVSLNVTSQGSN